MRGARERHDRAVRCDGRRWRAGRTAPDAYGEVVWSRCRGAGVKSAIRRAGDGGKRAVLRGEHEASRKAIAQGRPGCFRRTCMLVCTFCLCANGTRDRGCGTHPVFPAPSDRRGQTKFKTSGRACRENAASCSVVIPACAGMTARYRSSVSPHSQRRTKLLRAFR
jgi:hypothetical protein